MKFIPANKLSWGLGLLVFLCSGIFVVEASEIFATADTLESGAWAVSVYGREAEIEPVLKISDASAVQVPTSAGTTTIFSGSNTEIEMEQQSNAVIALFEFRPYECLTYKVKAGQVRDFEIEFASGSQTNKLEALNEGYVWGLGLSGSLAPASIVSTGIAWELNYSQTNVTLDRFQGGDIIYSSNQKFKQEEIQGSVRFSRRWKSIEPYAGLKVLRFISRLQDQTTKEHVSGTKDGASPFIGLQWLFANRESFIVEASFLDEMAIGAGLKIQFGK